MTGITSPAGTFGYSYNFEPASSLITGISLPNGATITNSYDGLARLTQTALNNYWGHPLDSYTYTPDALGLRTNIVRNLGLTSSTVTAGFDNIGQLTSWNVTDTGGSLRQNEQLGFGYDAAHNLHTRNNGNLAQTFITDAANQLNSVTRTGTFTLSGATPAPATNVTVNGQTAQAYGDFTFALTNLSLANGTNSFTNIAQNAYGIRATNILTVNLPSSVSLNSDGNGSLTNDGMRTFGYDAENQLTNITLAGQWRSDFVYDGLNRRRISRDYSWSGSAWVETNEIHYICDGRLLIQERGSNNSVLVSYTRGLDLGGSLQLAGGIGGLLARTDTNGSTFYHADGNGNVTALIDGNENIVARYLYNPFGKLTGQWGPMANANSMQFSSMPQYRGLVMYPRRANEPNFQRWLNRDPIEENGGINLYTFIWNSPVNYYDPHGLYSLGEWGQIIGAGAGGWSDAANSLGQSMGGTLTGNLDYAANGDDLSQNAYSAMTGFDPTGLLPLDPNDPNAEMAAMLGMAAGMLDGSGEAKAAGKGLKAACKKLEKKPRSPFPPAKRDVSNTRKEAREKATQAGDGNKPINDANGHPGDPRPHFHPADDNGNQLNHDHYYYPK